MSDRRTSLFPGTVDSLLSVLLSALGLCAAGCNPLGVTLSEQRLARGGKYDVIEGIRVPRVRGPSGCGAQALAAVMGHADPSLDVQAECDALPWHDAGATVIDMLLTARAKGFQARVSRGTWDSLHEFVRRGQPVMVMFDRNLRVWTLHPKLKPPEALHWGVVSGVSKDGKRLLCAAPGGRHYVIDRKVFIDCWQASDNCTVTVARPPTGHDQDSER